MQPNWLYTVWAVLEIYIDKLNIDKNVVCVMIQQDGKNMCNPKIPDINRFSNNSELENHGVKYIYIRA